MLASPTALGESTGSAPVTVTQTLPAMAMHGGDHEELPGPAPAAARLDGPELAADGGDHAAEQEPGAAGGLAGLLGEQRGLEQHRENDAERSRSGHGHRRIAVVEPLTTACSWRDAISSTVDGLRRRPRPFGPRRASPVRVKSRMNAPTAGYRVVTTRC